MRRAPKNYIDYRSEGYGLWEVWYDLGPGTMGYRLAGGFLVRREAADYAKRQAQAKPSQRFKVVLRRDA